jgi:hypothetical protein
MNIIFDPNIAKELADKYTVLELDTVIQPNMTEPLTLYAVIEINNIGDIATLSFFRELHKDMVVAYKSSVWEKTIEFATALKGQFGGELDEFYDLVIDFAAESAKVNRIWDGVKHTVPKE